MNSDGTLTIKSINNLYSCFTNFLGAVDKGLTPDIAAKFRSLEAAVQQLRESVDAITDISTDEEYQKRKIESLQDELARKDALIESLKKNGNQ